MKKFVVFESPAAFQHGETPLRYAEGSAFDVILRLLDECSLTELHRLKLHEVLAAQKRVKAIEEKAKAEAKAEFARTGVATPSKVNEEDDEPSDLDATPLAPPEEIDEAIRVNNCDAAGG